MKKSYIQFIALGSLSALTLIYSCKKYLNKPPVGSESTAGLASKAGVDGLLIGAYSMLDGYTTQSGTGWESSTDNWVYGTVAADDAYKGSNTTDQPNLAPIENHSVDPSDEFLNEKYSFFYNAIQRANDAIREIPLVKDGSVTPAYAAEVTAEARFLRGIYHMEEAKVFRNVPYVDETITYATGNYTLPNPGPIWDKIEADFMAAMAGLPKIPANVGRGYYYAAEAFLAKAYMFDHKYSLALPLLTDLQNNGTNSNGVKFALGAFNDNFHAATKNGPEGVFQVQNTVADGSNGNNGFAGDVLNFPGGGFTSCCGFDQPSYSLANSYKVDANGLPMFQTDPATGFPAYDDVNLPNDHQFLTDPSGAYRFSPDGGKTFSGTPFTPTTLPLDSRIDWTLGRRGIPYLDWGLCAGEAWSRGDVIPYNPIKNVFYEAEAGTTSDAFNGWAPNQDVANNYNMIRFADVILWKAECEVETNNITAAQTDVNLVRARAANPAYWVYTYLDNTNPQKGSTQTSPNPTPAANYKVGLYGAVAGTDFASKGGQAYARQAVYFERRLELAMEGHRFFDLQRWDGLYGGPAGTGYMAGVLNAYIKADTRISNPVLNGHSFTPNKNELFPIPQPQIDIEHGTLKQNPGY